jgi:uncharacterized membrane protein
MYTFDILGEFCDYTDKFLDEKLLYAHMQFVYSVAALFHGLWLVLLVFLAMLFGANHNRSCAIGVWQSVGQRRSAGGCISGLVC